MARLPPDGSAWADIHTIARTARARQRTALCQLVLPRRDEGVAFEDDQANARRVAAAFLAALDCPDLTVFIDTFIDHDRGYYPRHGLLDRRSNPRAAQRVLTHLSRLLSAGPITRLDGATDAFETPAGLVVLGAAPGADLGAGWRSGPGWVDLLSGTLHATPWLVDALPPSDTGLLLLSRLSGR